MRKAFGPLFVVVGAAIAWLAFARSEPVALGAADRAGHGVPTPAPPIASTRTTTASAPAVAAPAGARTVAAAEAVAAPLSIPADARWLTVTIVDGSTQQPVAGADVAWLDATTWTRAAGLTEEQRRMMSLEPERLARAFGWRSRSGADGSVRIHLQVRGTLVFASAEGRYGETRFWPDRLPSAGARVVLSPDKALCVHVLTAGGAPATTVPVKLEPRDPSNGTVVGGDRPTDRNGSVTFAHVQQIAVLHHGAREGQRAEHLQVEIAIPGLGVEPVLVPADSPPADVEITLPPTGRVRARIVFDGAPIPGEHHVRLHAGPKGSSDGQNRAWYRPVDADGWARFDCVPLGATFYLGGSRTWDLELVGPTVADQEVAATFDLAGEIIALAGRVLDADGRPVADEDLNADFHCDGMSGGLFVRTDAGGRFLCALVHPDRADAIRLTRFSIERMQPGSARERATATPCELRIGRNDLGDLRLAALPLVVGGRLEFAGTKGRPPNLLVERFTENRSGAPTWQLVSDQRTAFPDDDHFEVRAAVEQGRFRLRVVATDCLPVEPIEFELGRPDLVVALRRGTPLLAHVRLPDGIRGEQLLVALRADGPAALVATDDETLEQQRDLLRAWPRHADDGAVDYRWTALADGSYTLALEAPGFAEPLFVLRDVAVPEPEGGDARLRDLDLRDQIGALHVHVTVDPQLADSNELMIALPQPQTPATTWQGVTLHPGDQVLPVPKHPIDLLVVRELARPVELRAVVDRVDVTLEAWPTVDVRVLGAEALPAATNLYLSAELVDPDPRSDESYQVRTAYGVSNGGQLAALLRPPPSAPVKDGIAALRLAGGLHRLRAFVKAGKHVRSALHVDPATIVAGSPLTVKLLPEEVATVAKQLPATAKK